MDRRVDKAERREPGQDGRIAPPSIRRTSRLPILTRGTLALLVVGAGVMILSARQTGKVDDAIQGRIRRQAGAVRAVAFAPVGGTLALAHRDGTVRLTDDRGRANLIPPKGMPTGEAAVLCLGFSPDGRTLACGDARSDVTLWDITEDGQRRAHLPHKAPVLAVAFSPDGRTLATGSEDGSVRLWGVSPVRERAVLRGHRGDVWTVAFSPDGRTLATGSEDGTIRFWDVATWAEVHRLAVPHGRVTSLAFSPDGRTLASGGGFHPDNSGGELVLWDVATGTERARPRGHRGFVTSVAFSPDGQTVASGSVDQSIRLWDVATGKPRATLAGHEGFVASVAFSPDGRWLASGGDDTLSGLWNLAAQNLAGHPAPPSTLADASAPTTTQCATLDPSDDELMLSYEKWVSLAPVCQPRSLPNGDQPPGSGVRPKL